MVISILNGSPKVKQSNTQKHLGLIAGRLTLGNTVKTYSIHKHLLNKEELEAIMDSDVLIIGFPLYVDGLPSHLLEQLRMLEHTLKIQQRNKMIVYAVANNGFYEGEQNEYALEMIAHFCQRAGVKYGQGIGIGTGEMIGQLFNQNVPVGKGPLTRYGKAMEQFITHIQTRAVGENTYVQADFPAFLFKLMAQYTFWNKKAKQNGVSKKQLKRKDQLE